MKVPPPSLLRGPTMTTPVPVQLGLFGGCAEIADMHVVSAHTRNLADGSEVFVGEHFRWNRGRLGPRVVGARQVEPPADHPLLFDLRRT